MASTTGTAFSARPDKFGNIPNSGEGKAWRVLHSRAGHRLCEPLCVDRSHAPGSGNRNEFHHHVHIASPQMHIMAPFVLPYQSLSCLAILLIYTDTLLLLNQACFYPHGRIHPYLIFTPKSPCSGNRILMTLCTIT